MAISDKLNYLIETKQLFKDRLNSLGAEITSSTTFRNYLTWLDTFYEEVSNKTDISQNGIVGRTSQETTSISGGDEYDSPSPDYPQPINNLSGNVLYKVSGNNLLKIKNNYSYELNGITISTNGDVITIDGTADANINYSGFSIFDNHYYAESGKTYTETIKYISGTCPGNTGVVNLRNGNNTEDISYQFNNYGGIGILKEQDLTQTINVSNTGSVARDGYINSIQFMCNNGATFDNYKIKIQLEKGTTATTYEPYIEPQTFTIPLGDIELCKIDTYEDKIYSSDGRFYLKKEINKTVLNGNENWVLSRITGTTNTTRYRINNADFGNVSNLSHCDKFINRTASMSAGDYECILSNNNTIYISIFINRLSEDTIAAFKSWLSLHNTIVYYPVITPTITEITSSNYPELYAALKEIQDYLTSYKINKEFILGYSSPNSEY